MLMPVIVFFFGVIILAVRCAPPGRGYHSKYYCKCSSAEVGFFLTPSVLSPARFASTIAAFETSVLDRLHDSADHLLQLATSFSNARLQRHSLSLKNY